MNEDLGSSFARIANALESIAFSFAVLAGAAFVAVAIYGITA